MAIVFPASPSVNDTFTAGSITYKWDGAKWIGLGVTPADRLVEGSNSLEITANNELQWTGGNVGIGTDPTRPLHLHNTSTSTLLVSGTAPQIRFNSDAADGVDDERGIIGLATGAGQFMSNTASGDLVIRSENGNSILFGNGTNEKVRIGAGGAGQIGIGTTPTTNAALDINQGYYSVMYGAVNGANGGRADNTNKEGRIVQYHRDNEEEPLGAIVTFSQSTAGSVFIGGGSSLVNAATETALFAAANTTTTGGTKMLSVTTSGVTANELFTVTHPDGTSADTMLLQNTTSGGNNRVRINCFANGGGDPYIKFDAGGSNMIVGEEYNGTTNNKLCLGVGETPSGVTGITINGLGQTVIGAYSMGSEQLRIRGGEADLWLDSDGSGIWRILGSTGGSTHQFRIYDNTNSADRLTINSSGRVRLPGIVGVAGSNLVNVSVEADGNLCTTTSIRAAKTNISPLADTSWLFDLNPVTFNWRTKTENEDGTLTWGEEADGGIQYGLIAEEVEAVKDDFCYYDNDGELSGVHYDRLVAPLLKVVQQQKEEIETLKGRLNAAGI